MSNENPDLATYPKMAAVLRRMETLAGRKFLPMLLRAVADTLEEQLEASNPGLPFSSVLSEHDALEEAARLRMYKSAEWARGEWVPHDAKTPPKPGMYVLRAPGVSYEGLVFVDADGVCWRFGRLAHPAWSSLPEHIGVEGLEVWSKPIPELEPTPRRSKP